MQLRLDRIKELGASLIAISPESPENLLLTVEKNSLTFQVLSDQGNRIARQFGIVFQLPVDLRPIYASFGIDLVKADGDDSFELPIPATYVIGRDRKIRRAFVDPDYTRRLDPQDIIAVLTEIAEEEGKAQVKSDGR